MDSIEQIGPEYSRGCTLNMKIDIDHWNRCSDPNHPGIEGTILKYQVKTKQ